MQQTPTDPIQLLIEQIAAKQQQQQHHHHQQQQQDQNHLLQHQLQNQNTYQQSNANYEELSVTRSSYGAPQPPALNDNDKAYNQQLKNILQQSSELEILHHNSNSIIDFFSTQAINLEHKLVDCCLKLVFNPETRFKLEHFRKIEEIIWKRCYHDLYRYQKAKRNLAKKQDEHLINTQFTSGLGFYSNLIIQLRTKFKIHNLSSLPEPLNYPLKPLDEFSRKQTFTKLATATTDASKGVKDWALQALYRSLVYMGDLARYLCDLNPARQDYRSLSFYYYFSAGKFAPENGLPYNQLATLAGNSNYNLDAITNYMRCCLKQKPFEGAHINLQSLFELNQIAISKLNQKNNRVKTYSQVLASKDPGFAAESLVKEVIMTFIKLTSDLYNATTQRLGASISQTSLVDQLTQFFEILQEALDIDPIEPIINEEDYEKCRTKFTPVSHGQTLDIRLRYIDTTIMYEFCCLSLMLQTNCLRIKQINRIDKTNGSCVEEYVINSVNTLSLNLLHYATSKSQKQILSKIHALRIIKINVDLMDCGNRYLTKSLEDLYIQTHIPTIKVYCDWLLANSDIIGQNIQSFISFSSELAELIILCEELIKVSKELDQSVFNNSEGNTSFETSSNESLSRDIILHNYNGPDWKQKYPLSCDFPLSGMDALESVHKLNINFDYQDEGLTNCEYGFIAYQCLEAFNDALKAFLTKVI